MGAMFMLTIAPLWTQYSSQLSLNHRHTHTYSQLLSTGSTPFGAFRLWFVFVPRPVDYSRWSRLCWCLAFTQKHYRFKFVIDNERRHGWCLVMWREIVMARQRTVFLALTFSLLLWGNLGKGALLAKSLGIRFIHQEMIHDTSQSL